MPQMNRPLSPHLGIYKWSVTMALSVLHRATGVALSLCALSVVAWIVAAESGPEAYAAVTTVLTGWFGILLLLGLSVSFFIHLGNGIRLLFWDAGYGFGIATAHRTGVITLLVALALTGLFLLGVFS